MEFGEAKWAHLLAGNGQVIANSSYRVVDGAAYHLFSSTNSGVASTSDKAEYVTIEGEPHFSGAFAIAQTASVINWRIGSLGRRGPI